MTRKQRFMTALDLEQPDRVPMFDFLFQQPMYEALIGHAPEGYNGPDAVRCALALDHDAVWVPFGGFSGYQPKFLEENVYQDEWGTVYRKNESSWPIDAPIDYPIKTRSDLEGYRPPTRRSPGARTRSWLPVIWRTTTSRCWAACKGPSRPPGC